MAKAKGAVDEVVIANLFFVERADEFLWAYHMLPRRDGIGRDWPKYHLFGCAVELMLKAYLLTGSATQPPLKELELKSFGHDLVRLLEEAGRRGLPFDAETANDIRHLSRVHFNDQARYPFRVIEKDSSMPAGAVVAFEGLEPKILPLFDAIRAKIIPRYDQLA